MKKVNLIYGIFAILVATFVACSKDNDDNSTSSEIVKELTLDKDSVALIVGETTTATITDGNGSYSVVSSADAVATASVSATVVSVNAVKDGVATLTISDAKNKTKTISVKVFKSFGVAENAVTMKIGDEKLISVADKNGTFTAVADNDNVEVSVDADNVKVIAKKVGVSTIVVTDTESRKTAEISVTVEDYPDMVLSETDIEMYVAETQSLTISGGSGVFSVTTDNNKIEVSLNANEIEVKALTVGSSKVIITDLKNGKKTELNVVVKNYTDVVLSETSVNLTPNTEKEITLDGGSGVFTATTSSSNVEVSVNGNKLKIKALGAGNATVIVKDVKSGKEKTLTVTVAYTNLEVDTTSIVVKGKVASKEGEIKVFNISGGSGEYEVTAAVEATNIKLTKISDTQYSVQGDIDDQEDKSSMISIVDKKSGETKTVSVRILARFRINGTATESIKIGETTTFSYFGQKPEQVGTSTYVEVVSIGDPNAQGEGIITIKGLAVTSNTEVLTFKEGDDVYTRKVEVLSVPDLGLFSSSDIWLAGSQTETEIEFQGSGNFTVEFVAGEPQIAIISSVIDQRFNNMYTVKFNRDGDKNGVSKVKFTDNATGQTKTLQITVRPKI